jgi:hypothetical protein
LGFKAAAGVESAAERRVYELCRPAAANMIYTRTHMRRERVTQLSTERVLSLYKRVLYQLSWSTRIKKLSARSCCVSSLSHSNGGGDAINGFVGANCLRNCARAVDVGQNLNNLIGQLLRGGY